MNPNNNGTPPNFSFRLVVEIGGAPGNTSTSGALGQEQTRIEQPTAPTVAAAEDGPYFAPGHPRVTWAEPLISPGGNNYPRPLLVYGLPPSSASSGCQQRMPVARQGLCKSGHGPESNRTGSRNREYPPHREGPPPAPPSNSAAQDESSGSDIGSVSTGQ